MSLKRLLALRSFQQLPQGLQTAVQAHLLHGIDGPEACRMAGLTNPERTWSRDRVKQVLEEYRSGTGAEQDEPSGWELVRQMELADGGKTTLPADCANLPEPDPEAMAEVQAMADEVDRRLAALPKQESPFKPSEPIGGTPTPTTDQREPISRPSEPIQETPIKPEDKSLITQRRFSAVQSPNRSDSREVVLDGAGGIDTHSLFPGIDSANLREWRRQTDAEAAERAALLNAIEVRRG